MSRSLRFSHRSEIGRHVAALDASGGLSTKETADLRELLVRLDQVLERIESAESRHLSTRLLLGFDHRLRVVENSALFRALRWGGRIYASTRTRVTQGLQTHFRYLYGRRASPQDADSSYEHYLASRQFIPQHKARFAGLGSRQKREPLFSVLMAVSRADPWMLADSVDSVLSQQYQNWELIIVASSSDSPVTGATLESKARQDPRITVLGCPAGYSPEQALALAARSSMKGDYIAFLQQHDQFLPGAFSKFSEAIARFGPDVVYTDEDHMNAQGRLFSPIFKPGWSPELLRQQMYLGRGLLLEAKLFHSIGGTWPCEEESAEHPLAIRLAQQCRSACHIPEVLFRRRTHREQLGSGKLHARPPQGSLPVPYVRSPRDVAFLHSSPERAESGVPASGARKSPVELASIVICTKSAKLLRRCLNGIKKHSGHVPIETLVVNHLPHKRDEVARVAREFGCVLFPYAGSFNFSRMNNLACMRAKGDVFIFLNDDTVPVASDWVLRLATQAVRPLVGAVGAKLLYPSGAIQHAGIALGLMDGVGHPLRGTVGGKYWPWDNIRREVSAVTGACLAMRSTVFEEIGGFDPRFPRNYNDVDLCLRLRENGYSILYEPAAMLTHQECATRDPAVTGAEKHLFYSLWGHELEKGDPFYNPNLSIASEDASLRMDFE